jgi:hypothetical protein
MVRSATFVGVFACVLSTGCGPIWSSVVIANAEADVAAATAANAETLAPYEYTSATEYLQKAREEQSFAEFEAAIDFANVARDQAQKGTKRAQEMRSRNPIVTKKPAAAVVPVTP